MSDRYAWFAIAGMPILATVLGGFINHILRGGKATARSLMISALGPP
jgi:hypothetical protein